MSTNGAPQYSVPSENGFEGVLFPLIGTGRSPSRMPKQPKPAKVERIRLLLVDDHRMVIDGLRAILDQEPLFEIVGDASNGEVAFKLTRSLKPHVVIMDISMPVMDGIEATRLIRKKVTNGAPAILVLSMYGNKEFVDELMAAGANGYVLKNTGREELREAILTVHDGGRYFAKPVQEILDQAHANNRGEASQKPVLLSKREKEVVRLIVADKTIAEIADLLHLSPSTVETHRRNVYHKLGIHTAGALVKYAMERGWGNADTGN